MNTIFLIIKFVYVSDNEIFYVCLKSSETGKFEHQGIQFQLKINVFTLLLPIWVMVCMIALLLCLSGLFSGKKKIITIFGRASVYFLQRYI